MLFNVAVFLVQPESMLQIYSTCLINVLFEMKSETVLRNRPNKLQTSVAIPRLYIFISFFLSLLLSFNSFLLHASSGDRCDFNFVLLRFVCVCLCVCVCVGVNDKVNSYSFDFTLRSSPSWIRIIKRNITEKLKKGDCEILSDNFYFNCANHMKF